ncbi:MAG: hypothetical protein HY270_00925 [Deltaproteobacteria bacterium]|nr:hypothetical protein [Deltaproteobacteria bacterium]
MAASQLTVRLVGLVVGILAIWYIAHLHGQIADLQNQLAQGQKAPARAGASAAAPAAPARQGVATGESVVPRTISESARHAMVAKLSGDGSNAGSPVWFATIPNNPEVAALQKTLQSIFEEAGWQVKGTQAVGFPMKAGIYLFSADENPPSYIDTLQEAFDAAGMPITSAGRGYRDFYKQKKAENPNWIGFELAEDQGYVLAIGRKPEPAPQTLP